LIFLFLLIREAAFRLGPPGVVALVFWAIGRESGLKRPIITSLGLFIGGLLLWNLVIANNPQWTRGWYSDPL